MKIWVVECRWTSKDAWVPWEYTAHPKRSHARSRMADLKDAWEHQFRVRAYERVEGSK